MILKTCKEIAVFGLIFGLILFVVNKSSSYIFNKFGVYKYFIKKFSPNPVPKYIIYIMAFVIVLPAAFISSCISKKVCDNGQYISK